MFISCLVSYNSKLFKPSCHHSHIHTLMTGTTSHIDTCPSGSNSNTLYLCSDRKCENLHTFIYIYIYRKRDISRRKRSTQETHDNVSKSHSPLSHSNFTTCRHYSLNETCFEVVKHWQLILTSVPLLCLPLRFYV